MSLAPLYLTVPSAWFGVNQKPCHFGSCAGLIPTPLYFTVPSVWNSFRLRVNHKPCHCGPEQATDSGLLVETAVFTVVLLSFWVNHTIYVHFVHHLVDLSLLLLPRAEARYRLWLHKKGHSVLTLKQLRIFHSRLAQHHSRDPVHLLAVRQTLHKQASAMAEHAGQPWRCGHCKRLIKAITSYCPDCGGHWTVVQDVTYKHGQAGKPKSQPSAGWEWSQWSDGGKGSSNRTQSPRQRSASRRARQQRKGKGKGKQGEVQEAPGAGAPSFPSLPVSPFTPTGSYMHCGDLYYSMGNGENRGADISQSGTDSSSAQSLSRSLWYAIRTERYIGQDGEPRDEENNLGSPQVHSCAWQSNSSTPRTPRVEDAASTKMDASLDCIIGGLEVTDGELRQATAPVQHPHPTGHNGATCGSEVDSTAERQSSARQAPRDPTRRIHSGRNCGGSGGWTSGCRGASTQSTDASSHCWYGQASIASRGRSGRLGGNTKPFSEKTTLGGTQGRGDERNLVSKGDIVSCLRKGQCAPLLFYKSVLFVDVEAYGNDCCAASVSNRADLDPLTHAHSVIYEDDCLYDFAAIGNAHILQGELLIDETNDNISRHLQFIELEMNSPISKIPQSGGVNLGPDEPTICADDTLLQCPTTSVHMNRPFPFAFADAWSAELQDMVISQHEQSQNTITIYSFGYKFRYLEQRIITLQLADLPRWREKLKEQWQDHIQDQPHTYYPLRPPPFINSHAVSVILHIGEGRIGEVLILTHINLEDAHAQEPVVVSVTSVSTRREILTKTGLRHEHHHHAIVKQGHEIWLTGFPRQLSNGDSFHILTDSEHGDLTSLFHSGSASSPQITSARLLGEARARAAGQRQLNDEPADPPQQVLPPPQGGANRLFPWHLWEQLFNDNLNGERQVNIIYYGLALEPVGTRFGWTTALSRTTVFRLARQLYPELVDWDLRLHLVTPQLPDPFDHIHVLAEFTPDGFEAGNLVPVLLDVKWFDPRQVRRAHRAPAYYATPTNKMTLIDDLADHCQPTGALLCSVWTRGLPCLDTMTATLLGGDLVSIRLLPMWNDEITYGVTFSNGPDFYHYGATITHNGPLQAVTARIFWWDSPPTERVIPQFNVDTLREIGTIANVVWGQRATITFCRAPSSLQNGWYFLVTESDSEATPLLLEQRYRDETGQWVQQYDLVLQLPGMSIDQCIRYNTQQQWHGALLHRELQLDHRPLTDEALFSGDAVHPGALVTITIEEQGQLTLPHATPVPAEEEESDESIFSQSTLFFHGRRVSNYEQNCEPIAFRPDAGANIDFDDYIPYERRFSNGDHFSGRIIPPPRWHDHPMLRQAADAGAVRRNDEDQLHIHCRTWLLPHDGPGHRRPRDMTIPAQLMVQLAERVRRLWNDHLGTADAIRTYIVHPTPSPARSEAPMVHIIVERNRPIASEMRPILMSFQQISASGLHSEITWQPILAPPAFSLQFIQQVGHVECEAHHLLIPQAARARGWMTTEQQRHVVPGTFIPVWWDLRRRRTNLESRTEEEDDEHHSLLQHSLSLETLDGLCHPHVFDLWCDGQDHPVSQGREVNSGRQPLHEITNQIEASSLMQRGSVRKRKSQESSPSTTPGVQAFHVFRLTSSYALMPAPPPDTENDVPGYILGLMSQHFGFPADEQARCHPIHATISDLTTLPAFIYEHGGDSYTQLYSDDVLTLVDIHRHQRYWWRRTSC